MKLMGFIVTVVAAASVYMALLPGVSPQKYALYIAVAVFYGLSAICVPLYNRK